MSVTIHQPNQSNSPETRPAARAGMFYPGSAADLTAALDRHFAHADDVTPQTHAAVMLPHAGWRFSGDTAARTIARCNVPRNVIILGPNHTGQGAPLAVTPHAQWELPGLTIPIATDIAGDVAAFGFTRDAEAHAMEHGSEVLLPFLHRMNSALRVLPLVIGRCHFDQAVQIGKALAAIAQKHEALLVISSDMNHFAPEPESRRLDALALDAMRSGDPRKLYDTCTKHRISMCGMIPAVIVMTALLQSRASLTHTDVHYTTSAQASGDPSSVVGYAGVLLD